MQYTLKRSNQSGMAMIMSLIMLLLMSLIILHGARTSNLELLLGNNVQNNAQALMQAEDSAVAAENLIEVNYAGAPTVDFSANPADGLYVAGEVAINSVDWSNVVAERVAGNNGMREYIIEYLGPTSATGGSLSVGAGVASDTRYIYRVSGRGQSSRGAARVVQTIYATTE